MTCTGVHSIAPRCALAMDASLGISSRLQSSVGKDHEGADRPTASGRPGAFSRRAEARWVPRMFVGSILTG